MEIQPTTGASPISSDSADLATQRLIAEVLAERRTILDSELRSAAEVVKASNSQIADVNTMTTSVQFGANEAEFGINDFDQISDTNREPFVQRTMPNGNPMIDVGDGYGVVVEPYLCHRRAARDKLRECGEAHWSEMTVCKAESLN